MQAMIFAVGKGTRVLLLTAMLPKRCDSDSWKATRLIDDACKSEENDPAHHDLHATTRIAISTPALA